MTPRIKKGSGVTGAVRYVLGEGRDYTTGRPRSEAKGEDSRVLWMAGQNFGFDIESSDDADLARRIMEFDALNQASRTKPCIQDCVHISLGWREGETPTQAQMIAAAEQALAAIGMANAKALLVAHGDEPYAHLHIVASKINPATGYAYDLKGDHLKLSRWAEAYEREFSGGIISTRRVEANLIRDAIEARNAPALLELMTTQRATFKGTDLERALAKQIKSQVDRAAFAEQVLTQPGIVRLADQAGGPVTRYTTRAVLEAEAQVLHAATALMADRRHGVSLADRQAVLAQPEFASISREQVDAMRHATEAPGLALIDGQAGTGKSHTISAIRQAYERGGYQVIGLGPTNAVATDMRDSGFAHAATIHSELFALKNGRTAWNDRTVIILDEAAMIDTKLMAQLTTHAKEAGAALRLIGDDRQLSSINRGGLYGVLKDLHGAAELSTVRRQLKADDRRASELMAEGNFDAALGIYDGKGAITWTQNQTEAREALVAQWAKDSAADPSKSRFVFAYTNDEVSRMNADLRAVRQQRGELDGPDHTFTTKHGRADFAARDRIQVTGTDKKLGLENGQTGTVEKIDGSTIAVRLDGSKGRTIEIDAATFQEFRHGYAGTIYKGQGRTLDQTYLYHSEHWRSASSYVALTRHRDKAELFVARNTAADVKTLGRQMARVDDRRAASHFHQADTPLTFQPVNSNALPSIELPRKEQETAASAAASRGLDWTDRGGMPAQQHSALKAARQATPTAAPAPAGQPLTANEVAASANDPALRARYNQQEEQRQAKPAAASAPTKTRGKKQPKMTDAERKKFEQLTRHMTRENDERAAALEQQYTLSGGRSGRTRTR